jgi:hypothetical protein
LKILLRGQNDHYNFSQFPALAREVIQKNNMDFFDIDHHMRPFYFGANIQGFPSTSIDPTDTFVDNFLSIEPTLIMAGKRDSLIWWSI